MHLMANGQSSRSIPLDVIAESTPGPIMVNMATYIGSSQGGLLGALIDTTAVVLPAFVIILLIMVVLKKLLGSPYVQAVLGGLLYGPMSRVQ